MSAWHYGKLDILIIMQGHNHLLALCYYHCNQGYRSYQLLRGCQGAQSRYLLALCCLQLGKLTEAREALRATEGQVRWRGGSLDLILTDGVR